MAGGVLDLFLGNQSISLTLIGQEFALEQGVMPATVEWVVPPAATQPDNLPYTPMISARILNGVGVPVNGVVLTLVILTGNAVRIGTTVAVTDASGVATWTDAGLRSITGAAVTATVAVQALAWTGVPSTPSVAVTVAPATLAWVTAPSSPQADNGAFSPQPAAQLLDGIGRPMAGVSLTLGVVSGSATVLGADSATTNGSGVATWASVGLQSQVALPGSGTVRATAATVNGTPVTTSVAISLIAIPASLQILTMPTTGIDGQAFGVQPGFQLLDQHGNPYQVAGVLLTATHESGPGILTGNSLATSNASGIVTFTDLGIDE